MAWKVVPKRQTEMYYYCPKNPLEHINWGKSIIKFKGPSEGQSTASCLSQKEKQKKWRMDFRDDTCVTRHKSATVL